MHLADSKTVIPVILNGIRRRHPLDSAYIPDPKRILLVKQSERLGNIVLMNSAISGLRRTYPAASIDLLLPEIYDGVMAANANITRIIPVAKREYFLRPWKLFSVISELRETGYDLAINCSDVNSFSSNEASYTILSGAIITAGWQTGARRIFDIEVSRYGDTIHASEMYMRLFSGVTGREIKGEPYFDGMPPRKSVAENRIGINCGGRGSKRWPLENFVELGSILTRNGFECEFILGPGERELRSFLERCLPEKCNLVPTMSLPALMDRIRNYCAFVSSDSGPMHLAWCLGVPTVAIFVDSEIEKFRPLSPGSMAVDAKIGADPGEIMDLVQKAIRSGKVTA